MKNAFHLLALASISFVSATAGAAVVAVKVSDTTGAPLADVVLVAEPESGVAMPRHLKPEQIEQRGFKFLPLVSVIQTGSKVSFPNNDKVKHHIYSFSPAKKFDQKLYSGAAASTQVFDKAGIVVLGCNIHDRMVAYVKVVDSPFFTKSDAGGVARIDLPAGGKYKVSAWHYNMAGAAVEQAVVLTGDTPGALAFKLVMKPPVDESDSGTSAY